MELTVDFNTELVDAVKEASMEHPEKILELIHENFEASHQLTISNTKEMLDFYNKHTNLAVNFNEKFGESINAQIESLFNLQNKGLNKFTNWASEWWKQEENKATV
jgi:tRNA/tmRNA/rRNA uracil-C5-methylase (TrmA/RlmC/RlmD family)